MSASRQIDVSVVIAVHNGMPELTHCVTSVLEQSLASDRVQIVVVDDGSTDGTAAELQRLQEQSSGRLEVIHQPASGGPSRPRNVGLERAVGRYVFFLDADDYLASEALERLVLLADRNGADVVLGKILRHDGTSPGVFSTDSDDVSPFSARMIWSLNAQKLFRREMLEVPPKIRFPEDLWTGEDTIFTMRSYLRAGRISVLSSYTCYYKVRRPGGGHLTSRSGLEPRLRSYRAMIELITTSVPAGPRRDVLMVRPTTDLLRFFGPRYLRFDDARRREAFTLFAPLVRQWVTPGTIARLKPVERLKVHLVAQDRPDLLEELLLWLQEDHEPEMLVEDGRQYTVYPFFRDRRVDIPDCVFQVAGPPPFKHTVTALERRGLTSIVLRGVATVPATSSTFGLQLVLIGRQSRDEHRQPVIFYSREDTNSRGITSDPRVHYIAVIDLAPLWRSAADERVWDFFLEVEVNGQVARKRLGRQGSPLPVPPDPWLITRRSNRGSVVGERIAVVFTGRGALTVKKRPARLRSVLAYGLLKYSPLPPQVRRSLMQQVADRRFRSTVPYRRKVRRLIRRALTRINVDVLSVPPDAYVVTRRRDLAVTPVPASGFFVAPDRQQVQLREVDESSFLAWRNVELQDLGPDQVLVTTNSARTNRVIPLVDGATLITADDVEQERWLQQERALLNYAATRHILGVLKAFDINCVLDVGANRGQYGQLLRQAGYDGHIVSFEPVPAAVEALRRVTQHDEKWSVHAIALGTEEGVTTMQVVPGQATLSSMLPPSDYGRHRFPTMAGVVPHEVPVARLDALLDSVTDHIPNPRLYLKLDTQGFDLEVFGGLGARIRDIVALQSELALVEIYEGMPRMLEALAIYENAGFEVSGLFPVSREFKTTRIVEYDCILVRASAVAGSEDAKA